MIQLFIYKFNSQLLHFLFITSYHYHPHYHYILGVANSIQLSTHYLKKKKLVKTYSFSLHSCIIQAMPSRRLVMAQMLVCGNPSHPSCPPHLTLTLHREDGTGRPTHWMTHHTPMSWTVMRTIYTASVEACRYWKQSAHYIYSKRQKFTEMYIQVSEGHRKKSWESAVEMAF